MGSRGARELVGEVVCAACLGGLVGLAWGSMPLFWGSVIVAAAGMLALGIGTRS